MGWNGIELPEVKSKTNTVNDDKARIFVRGDLSGTFINYKQYEIEIPRELLLALVADYIRTNRIAILERASKEELLGL